MTNVASTYSEWRFGNGVNNISISNRSKTAIRDNYNHSNMSHVLLFETGVHTQKKIKKCRTPG